MSVKKFRFVSPGVFVNEIDNSQLPKAGVGMGPVVIGRSRKGPGMQPVMVESFSEFEQTFGTFDETKFIPYTVHQYLKHAGRITILRTLGLNIKNLFSSLQWVKRE